MLKVAVCGAAGKMGTEVIKAVESVVKEGAEIIHLRDGK